MSAKLSPFSNFLVVTAAFVVVVAGMKMAAPFLVPFLLAVFIAMIVSPYSESYYNSLAPRCRL